MKILLFAEEAIYGNVNRIFEYGENDYTGGCIHCFGGISAKQKVQHL